MPWWLVTVIVLYHGVFELVGRFPLLIVKSDVADPAVTAKGLRSDA